MCAQPCARKWVLREGMRGVLPELVRMRHGKSSMDGAFAHCLAREGNRLTRTVEGAEIAQLGIIEPGALRHAIQNGVSGGPHLRGHRLRPLYGRPSSGIVARDARFGPSRSIRGGSTRIHRRRSKCGRQPCENPFPHIANVGGRFDDVSVSRVADKLRSLA